MRIIIEDESCNLIENARLLLEKIKEDCLHSGLTKREQSVINKTRIMDDKHFYPSNDGTCPSIGIDHQIGSSSRSSDTSCLSVEHLKKNVNIDNYDSPASSPALNQSSVIYDDWQFVCDEVIRDSIKICREPDYKMELAGLLSNEAQIELYIENGKLSNAQRLACNMNRPDYVLNIIEEAVKLNQDHVKTVCQLWLAKHETRNFTR